MKKILIVLLAIVALVLGYAAYLGAFNKVEFKEDTVPEMKLVYLDHIGEYSTVHISMDSVYNTLMDMGIETKLGAGIYMDDPKQVAPEKLRSEVGCILEVSDYDKQEKIEKLFKVKTIPTQECTQTEMPYRSPMAIVIGVMKVYPALIEYMAQNNIEDGPIMELYDQENKVIKYIVLKKTRKITRPTMPIKNVNKSKEEVKSEL
jgi:hypothetical protein